MSIKILGKLSKFFVIAMGVIVVLAIVVVFSLRTILMTLNTASEVDEKVLEDQHERMNKANLDKAYEFLEKREIAPLDLQ